VKNRDRLSNLLNKVQDTTNIYDFETMVKAIDLYAELLDKNNLTIQEKRNETTSTFNLDDYPF
jgi:hypothetical protein